VGGKGDIRAYISGKDTHLFYYKSNGLYLSIGPFTRDDFFGSPSDIQKRVDGKSNVSLGESDVELSGWFNGDYQPLVRGAIVEGCVKGLNCGFNKLRREA
jgi:hypothetical protein